MDAINQVTTITFFHFDGWIHRGWGFGMMQFAHPMLKGIPGLQFYKLMGSGASQGFNPYPDWSVYAWLAVWDNEQSAKSFFQNSKFFKAYRGHTDEQWTIFMKNILVKGKWSGQIPFVPVIEPDPYNPLVAVVTRATIRWRWMVDFWKYVPHSHLSLSQNSGLIYTKGIGEAPFVQMATFSVWKDLDSIKHFAYQSEAHRRAIDLTRQLDWYSEELFSRFQPYLSWGTWYGKNPLSGYLPGWMCHDRHEAE